MRKSLFLLAATAVLPLLSAEPAAARTYPWCAFYEGGMGGGGNNSGFDTLAQCRDTVRGVGGYCIENGLYNEKPAPRSRRPRR